jgi:hypothetical protein
MISLIGARHYKGEFFTQSIETKKALMLSGLFFVDKTYAINIR